MSAAGQPLGDGDISREKLDQLLAMGGELDDLDFKEYLNLSQTKDKIELIKDFAAFQSCPTGGYIVVGVDGHGAPSNALGVLNAKDFDPANLTQLATSYLPTIRLRATTHVVDGIMTALIYVGPPEPPGVAIFTADGQYPDGKGSSKPVFRAGDVFVRKGTQSIRWSPQDLPNVLTRWEDAVREDERARASGHHQAQLVGERGKAIAGGPVGAIDWRLPVEEFDAALLEAIRAHDEIVLRAMSLSFGADAAGPDLAGDPAALDLLLDRVIAALAISITYAETPLFDRLLKILVNLCMSAMDGVGNPRHSPDLRYQSLLWRIATAIEALGGLAVRLTELWAVRPLAMPSSALIGRIHEPSWIRHALTAAAGVNLLYTASESDGKQVPIGGPAVAIARQLTERIPALHPDTHTPTFRLNAAPQSDDTVLDSLIQFDVLWGVAAVAHSGQGWDQYPSSAAFYARRAAPAFDLLITDDEARRLVLVEDEHNLKQAIQAVIETAQSVASNEYHRPWDLQSEHITQFFATV